MGLVVTRREKAGVRIITPSGAVDIKVGKIQSNQTRLMITCDRTFEIHRLDEADNIEKKYAQWVPPKDTMTYTYDVEDLHGKNLDMFVGVDTSPTTGQTVKVLMGKDKTTGKIYVIK